MHSRHVCLVIIAVSMLLVGFLPPTLTEAVPERHSNSEERGVSHSLAPTPGSVLQPGDVFSVQVLNEPQLTGTYSVGTEGTIELPMIGEVRAEGRTVPQLTEDLTARLQPYVLNPRVTITQIAAPARWVAILGAVRAPGNYDHREHGKLLSLLAAAGGPAPEADLERATLIREGEAAPVGVVGAEGVRKPMPRDVSLEVGDTVYIPSMAERAVRVIGAVGSPGLVALHEGMSVSRAVLAAGGATREADLRSVQLIRGAERLSLDLRPVLRPESVSVEVEARDTLVHLDDIIIVPQKEAHTVHVIGEVRAPGPHLIAEADRASKAVALSGGATAEGDLSRAYVLREGARLELDLRTLFKPETADGADAAFDTSTEPGDVVVVPPLRPVYVLGAVHQPGPVMSDRASTVTQALFSAGGLLPDADTSTASVVRAGGQIPVDMGTLLENGDPTADIALQPEDALIIPTEPQLVNIVGEVQSPGAFAITDASTLADLWGLSGGALPAANLRACLLLRGDETETVDVRALIEDGVVEQNLPLKPGDTLLVPKIRDEIYVFGEVREAGIQPIHEGDTIIDVIARAGGPTSVARIDRIALVRRMDPDQTPPAAEPSTESPPPVREPLEQTRERPDFRDRWGAPSREPAPAQPSRDPVATERIRDGDREIHLFDLAEVRDADPAYLARPGDVVWVPPRDLRRALFDDMLRGILMRAPFFFF